MGDGVGRAADQSRTARAADRLIVEIERQQLNRGIHEQWSSSLSLH
jgi:hypothetical protein